MSVSNKKLFLEAIFNQNIDLIKELYDTLDDKTKSSALSFLVLYQDANKNKEIIDYFLSKGVDINYSSSNGTTALHECAIYSPDLVQYLIDKGANKEAKNKNGDTPLSIAAYHSYNTCIVTSKYLIDAGANINTIDKDGNTPLHQAALLNNTGSNEIAKLLLLNGADYTIRNKMGETALEIQNKYGKTALETIRMKARVPKNGVLKMAETLTQYPAANMIHRAWTMKKIRNKKLEDDYAPPHGSEYLKGLSRWTSNHHTGGYKKKYRRKNLTHRKKRAVI